MSIRRSFRPRGRAVVSVVGLGTLVVFVVSSGLLSALPGRSVPTPALVGGPSPGAFGAPALARSDPHSPPSLGPEPGPALSPAPAGSGEPVGPYVQSTLALANGTVYPGNLAEPNGIPLGTMLYDPARGEVFIASDGGAHGRLEIVSDATDAVVASVPVGNDPSWLTYDPVLGEVFVSNPGGNSVSVVNDTTDTVVAAVPAPFPMGIAYDATDGDVYVTGYQGPSISVLDPSSNRVVGTIPVPSCCNGTGLAYDPARGALFVAVADRDLVYVVSTSSQTVLASVPVGSYPYAVTYDPAVGEVFVANQQSDNVSVINDTTDTVVATLGLGSPATATAYDGRTDQLFVAESAADNLTVINASTNTVAGTIGAGVGPDGLAYDGARGEVFVADGGSGVVSVVSDASDTIVATTPVTCSPDGLIYDPGQNDLFVSDYYDASVQVVSAASDAIVATVPVGSYPRGMAYDPRTDDVFVTDWTSSQVSVISDSTDAVVATVALPVGSFPSAAAYDPATGEVYVTDQFGNATSVIWDATDAVVASVPVGADPTSLAYDAGAAEIFVANAGSSNVSVLSAATGAVVATVPVPFGASVLAYDASLGELFVAGVGVVSVISDVSDEVVATVPVGYAPDGIAYDASAGELFVANQGSGNVSVVLDSSDTVAATVPVGEYPGAEAVDAANGLTYVANFVSGTLSILANGYANQVVFAETGLPSGTAWAVTLNGTRASSQQAQIGFLAANGSYPFAVANSVSGASGYAPVPAVGTVTAQANGPPVEITFQPYQLYNLTFWERGLPNGTNWSLEVGGDAYRSNLPAIDVPEANGTYPFVVGAVPGYTVSPGSGSLTVRGAPVSLPVNFTQATYGVSAVAEGLPQGQGWRLFLGSSTPGAQPFRDAACLHRCNGRPLFLGGLSDGTVPYVVSGPAGYQVVAGPAVGNLTLNGSNLSLTVRFAPGPTVRLGFSESGLSPGTRWCVRFLWTDCSTGTSLKTATPWPLSRLNLSRGSYAYAILPLGGRNITATVGTAVLPLSGSLDLVRSETVRVSYVRTFPVRFTETGLPPGTSWSVTVDGRTNANGTGGAIVFELPNGSHPYKVGSEPGYTGSGTPRAAQVRGAPASVKVSFVPRRGTPTGSPVRAVVLSTATFLLGGTSRRPPVRVRS